MAAEAAELEQLVPMIERIRTTTEDKDSQDAASLLIAMIQSPYENLFEHSTNSNTLNSYLNSKGYVQTINDNAFIKSGSNYNSTKSMNETRKNRIRNRLNTRYIYPESIIDFYMQVRTLLSTLQTLYTPEQLERILRVGLSVLASRVGTKLFDYRSVAFLNFLRPFVVFRSKLSDADIEYILIRPKVIELLTYKKDLQFHFPFNLFNHRKYPDIYKEYIRNRFSLLELLQKVYERDKTTMNLNSAQAKLANRLFHKFKDQLVDSNTATFILQKTFDDPDLDSLIQRVEDLYAASVSTNSEKFTNISGDSCAKTDIVSIDCGPKGKKEVCPSTATYEKDLVCTFFGGGRQKTRKQKRRSRRTHH